MSSIRPLPPHVVSQIHSSKSITSLQGVVLSLIENSLDGGSTKIDVSLDFSRDSCNVEDDGVGIAPSEFDHDGGLSKLYHTSKHAKDSSEETHGAVGMFLASLAALSLLTVTSRHIDHGQHATLVSHRGDIIARRKVASSPSAPSIAFSHGTCVSVRDLFGNLPVRLKQRALAAETTVEDDRAWEVLRRGIASLLLAWPRRCQVRVKDEQGRRRALLIGARPLVSQTLTKTSLDEMAGKSTRGDRKDTLSVLLQSGLVPTDTRDKWVPVAASTADLRVRGLICLNPAPSKGCQFISIGIYPCSPSSGLGELYDCINKLVAASDFGNLDELEAKGPAQGKRGHSSSRRERSVDHKLRARKGVDMWIMFVLQVKFSASEHNRGFADGAHDGTVKAVADILEATVEQWLASNHFRPRRMRRMRAPSKAYPAALASTPLIGHHPAMHLEMGSTSKRARSITSTPASKKTRLDPSVAAPSGLSKPASAPCQTLDLDSLTHIRSGRGSIFEGSGERRPASASKISSASRNLSSNDNVAAAAFSLPTLRAGELGSLVQVRQDPSKLFISSDDFGSIDETAAALAIEQAEAETIPSPRNVHEGCPGLNGEPIEDVAADAIVAWTDPVSKQIFCVNTRTGIVLPSRAQTSSTGLRSEEALGLAARQPAAIDTSKSSVGRQLRLPRLCHDPASAKADASMPRFLQGWNNPVYQAQDEEPIRRASLDVAQHTQAGLCWSEEPRAGLLQDSGIVLPQRISKSMLEAATVVNQVDRKFILCKVNALEDDADRQTLILVDQHAASERIILERLLAELCTANDHDMRVSFHGLLEPRIKAIKLDKPICFDVSSAEHEMFGDFVRHFADWAVLYRLSTAGPEISSKQRHTLIVHALPPTISERCIQTPKLIIEVLRSEIWKRADSARHARAVPRPASVDGEHPWLSRIGSCPKGIIDLLNSRACRSAVMFNDELTMEECRQMVRDLSGCASPFICAHGRVSMVPLVIVSDNEAVERGPDAATSALGHGRAGAGLPTQFRDDFKRWRQRASA